MSSKQHLNKGSSLVPCRIRFKYCCVDVIFGSLDHLSLVLLWFSALVLGTDL